ncbi:MAG: beta-ketoacyl-[acyl-carrier-protein] synthase family protein [Syntrophus sp. (in: bacteria)]|nr:beta-ketoacyl-[acyl-carrier-protein] synthase family protein [Syntrophus sp. (in: bacteria)]
MQTRRVVITAMGAISPFGRGVNILIESLFAMKSGVTNITALADFGGLRTHVAAVVPDMDPREIPRKYRRSMSKMSIYATLACQEAVSQGNVTEEQLSGGRLGISIGSTVGSPIAIQEFFEDFLTYRSLERMRATTFFQIMNHSCATNVAQALGTTGRILAPSSACSTGCQAIGYGFEMIASGKQDMMLCGGADEFHPLSPATFDIMSAASVRYNDTPHLTPRPFDRDRDGVVCSEGSGILLLEALDSAQKRGARIFAEITGFATSSDTSNIADPNSESIEACIRLALEDAGAKADGIDYVNAHATGTIQGDIAESTAIGRIFGNKAPVSSLKGHLGHTMAACGALETIASIAMIERGSLIPTLNLENVDPLCGDIRHIRQIARADIKTVLKNNFALGGVNTCIVIRGYANE